MRKEIKNIFRYAEVEKTGTNGYSYLLDNKNILDVQDCYRMSSPDQITSYWQSINRQEREILTQIICRTQAPDTFIDFLKTTVLVSVTKKIRDGIESHYHKRGMENQRREDDLYRKEELFQECKKSIFKHIKKLNIRIENLQFSLTGYQNQHSAILGDRSRLIAENKRYFKIKYLLRAISTEGV